MQSLDQSFFSTTLMILPPVGVVLQLRNIQWDIGRRMIRGQSHPSAPHARPQDSPGATHDTATMGIRSGISA